MTDFSKLVNAWQRFYTLLSQECQEDIEPLDLKPVLSQDEIQRIQKKWPSPIPQVLKDFWATGCSGIKFEYAKSIKSLSNAKRAMIRKVYPFLSDYITGSFYLYAAHDTVPQNYGWQDVFTNSASYLERRSNFLWSNCIVFAHHRDGDCYGILPQDN